jgi:hypothetical protein
MAARDKLEAGVGKGQGPALLDVHDLDTAGQQ